MTKLDELKALMTFHQENPDLNYRRYIFKEELYDNASALIAAVEALKEIADTCRAQRRRSTRPAVCVIAEWENIARAALAPFGE